jgi:hypothetical protein
MKFQIALVFDLPEVDGTPLPEGFIDDLARAYRMQAAQGIVSRINSLRRGPEQECELSGRQPPPGMTVSRDWRGNLDGRCSACRNAYGQPSLVRITAGGKVFKHRGFRWEGGPFIEWGKTALYQELVREALRAAEVEDED